MADFWGWEDAVPGFNDDDKGVSLVLLNTEKGKLFFEKASEDIEIKKVNPKDMRGTQIVSVGSSRDGIDGELKTISRMITSYRLMKEMEDRDHRRWLDNAD